MADVAVLSLHTSPLAQPGSGDSGGMNVYVRELVGSLAQMHDNAARGARLLNTRASSRGLLGRGGSARWATSTLPICRRASGRDSP